VRKVKSRSLSEAVELGGSSRPVAARPHRIPDASRCVPETGIELAEAEEGVRGVRSSRACKKQIGPHGLPEYLGRHKEVIAAMSFHKCAYCEGPSNGPPLLAHRRRASFIVVVEVARPGEPGCSVPRAPLAAARGNARFLSSGSRHRESPSPNHFSRSLGGPKQVAPTGDPPKHKCAPRPRIIVSCPKTL
jgi:hypothetical protein